MELDTNNPIGIFDSGVGGLTVASAIERLLPNESIVYFGDTAHLPYGDKSSQSIAYYSSRIARFLLEKSCKIIVIACNTASAYGLQSVQSMVAENYPDIKVIDVINPVVEYIAGDNEYQKVGVIGTKGTIGSGIYTRNLNSVCPEKEIISLATPLFAPMIEEGFIYDDISNAVIRAYLSKPDLQNIDSLILGCTHYPIIKNQIRKFFNFNVDVIDSSEAVAKYLRQVLQQSNLLCRETNAQREFYVSDYTDMFQHIARIFFDRKISLSQIDLWK